MLQLYNQCVIRWRQPRSTDASTIVPLNELPALGILENVALAAVGGASRANLAQVIAIHFCLGHAHYLRECF
jgi:hypothetical protein